MTRRYDCSDPIQRNRGIADAASSLRRGELVVLPTDTVYGIAADAFTPSAVKALLEAKGRGRDVPPPVLVGSVRAATALVDDLGPYGQDLIDEFWPGGLTLVCRANPNLSWDLGETKGTVAVRMPLHELALELLKETGPLAVSSANLSGAPAARSADEAEQMLGEHVAVYLDGGTAGAGAASTIVDLTGAIPKLLRRGVIAEDKVRAVCGVLLRDEHLPDEDTPPLWDPEEDVVDLDLDKPAEIVIDPEPALSFEQPAFEKSDSEQQDLEKPGAAVSFDKPAESAAGPEEPWWEKNGDRPQT